MGLKFTKTREVKSPQRAGDQDAGIDFFIPEDFKEILLIYGDSVLIPMGVKVKLPEVPDSLKKTHKYMLEFKNKSGIASKLGLTVGACVIDHSYQGELFLNLHRISDVIVGAKKNTDVSRAILEPGMKIVQGVLILVNTEEIQEVNEDDLYDEVSERGENGFGSNYNEKNKWSRK